MSIAFTSFSYSSANDGANNSSRVSQERTNVRDFNAITIVGSPTVHYTQGEKYSVKVVAPKRIIDDVKTEVEEHCLLVSLETAASQIVSGGVFSTNGINNSVEVYVTSPDIIGAVVTGSGDFISKKKVDTDKMKIGVQGSGDITFADIVCDDIRGEVIGSGDVTINNVNAVSAQWRVRGSGDMTVKQRNVDNTEIELVGSGDISVKCDGCGTVNSALQGSGDISLSGNVRSLQKTNVGSGDFHVGGLTIGKGGSDRTY